MSKIANIGKLKGHTVFITGASRGIGLAIGKKCAADGYLSFSIILQKSINYKKWRRLILCTLILEDVAYFVRLSISEITK